MSQQMTNPSFFTLLFVNKEEVGVNKEDKMFRIHAGNH